MTSKAKESASVRRERELKERWSKLTDVFNDVSFVEIHDSIAHDARIDLRLPRSEKELLKHASREAHVTLTEFIRHSALLVARKLIEI